MYLNLPQGVLGNAIRQARMDCNLSQEELAEIVGITPTHMKHIESEHRKPSLEVLYRLAVTLTLSLDRIFLPDLATDTASRQQAHLLIGQCNEGELHVVLLTLRALLETREKRALPREDCTPV